MSQPDKPERVLPALTAATPRQQRYLVAKSTAATVASIGEANRIGMLHRRHSLRHTTPHDTTVRSRHNPLRGVEDRLSGRESPGLLGRERLLRSFPDAERLGRPGLPVAQRKGLTVVRAGAGIPSRSPRWY